MLRQTVRSVRRSVSQAKLRLYSTESPDYRIDTLDNGVKVVTSPIPCHFAAAGIYISAGSRYESPQLSGSSHLMDRLSFKSTKDYTQEQMEQSLLHLGGNYMCSSSRETMLYQASTFHDDFNEMVKLLAETVTKPLITPEEVSEQVLNTEYEIQEIWQKPDLILPEIGHTTAFSGGLGRPLLCPEERLPLITPGMLWQYRHQLYIPSRMTAAFVGVSPEEALELADKNLGHLPKSTVTVPPLQQSTYTGGESCIPLPKPIGGLPEFHYLQVLYRGVGINDPDVYALATLQVLLGGGGSFSAGGPGKGMYSRLYTNVLNKYGYIESALGVNHSYSDDGLFGITCSSIPQASQYLSYIIGSQLSLLMTPGELTAVEVERAKNQLRSQLLMNLESRMVELEDMGRQVQLNGSKMPVSDMVDRVDKLTIKDLQRVARRVLRSGPPTIVMQGPRESFGDVADVLGQFGLGAGAKK